MRMAGVMCVCKSWVSLNVRFFVGWHYSTATGYQTVALDTVYKMPLHFTSLAYRMRTT
jgi:hypothetical protein